MAAGAGRYRDALRARDFRLLAGAFLVDQVGGWTYTVVLVVYVFDRTGSTAWVAATSAAGWIPRMLCSTYAGVLADRYERTRVLLVSAALSTVVMAGLAVVVALDAPVAVALLLRALNSALGTTYRPAAGALVPEIVEEKDLAQANALLGALESVVVVLGPALGGFLLLVGDPVWGIAINVISFVVAIVLVLQMRVRSRGGAGREGEPLRRQLAAGFQALAAQPVAATLIAFCALDTAVYGASTVLFVPISQHLGTGVTGYSYLLAGSALGGFLAAGLVNRLSASARLAGVIVGGMCVMALPFAVTALTRSPVLGFALQILSGAGMVLVDVLAISAVQRDVPRALLSRVLGILETVVPAAALVASLGIAALLRVTSLTGALLTVGLGFSVAALLGLPALLRADRRTAGAVRAASGRIEVLEGLNLFPVASRQALEQLAGAVEEVSFPAGYVVVREGDQADALWVIRAGEVSVTAVGETAEPRQLRSLGTDDYFGEIGLVHGLPRTATVTTTTAAELWRIPAEDFLVAMQRSALTTTALARSQLWLTVSHPTLSTTLTSKLDEAGKPA